MPGKINMSSQNYGEFEIHHNIVAIEDPRNPFTVAVWSDSKVTGAYKGDSGGMVTPVSIKSSSPDSLD